MPEDQTEAIRFLSDAASYGLPENEKVERHETHASLVFLAGDRAYKLKRAVRYPYLDYSTAARRRAMCEAELDINRRIAPDLYLETRTIVRNPTGGVSFGKPGEDGLDCVLVMHRFAERDLLEQICRRGVLSRESVRALAETVAGFHGDAERKPEFGGAAGIERVLAGNERILGGMTDGPFTREQIEQLRTISRERLVRLAPLLEARRKSGFVRRCHGDLHLNNICLINGRPQPFDAIEFNDDLSCIDVFYDLAFLLMDLDRHGARELANALLNRYLEKTADYEGVAALPLFLSCRAAIRAHVTVTTAMTATDASRWRERATDYAERANSCLRPALPRLVAIGGVSGTGKSTLAYALAPFMGASPGAVVLRSDLERKRLLGCDELERLPPEAYRRSITNRVYRTMAETAAKLVESGSSVIADAVHGGEDERARIEAVARTSGVPFHGFWLDAPRHMLEARIAARTKDASDATARVLGLQLSSISAPRDWTRLNASTPLAGILADARSHVNH